MMEDVIEKTEFTVNELGEHAKEQAREKNAESICNYEWYENTQNEWIEKLSDLGINEAEISFSGFWSQGDGASFTARINCKEFIEAHDNETNALKKRYFHLFEANKDDSVGNFNLVRNSHHYSHKNTVWCGDTDECRGAPSLGVYAGMDDEVFSNVVNECLSDWQDEVLEICRDYMDKIYKELEEEYEWLTSMEVFSEDCKANEWLFNEEGELL